MEDGSKKAAKAASIYDVAGEPGVSVFTVSAVINNKSYVGKGLRKRVEAAIRKLNYRPNLIARGLAKLRTHTIGMIVPDIANPFFPMVVRGAEDAAQKHGYNLPLCNSDDSLDKEKAVELLLSKRVDDILLTKAAEDFRSPVRQMIEEVNIPFVLVMRTYPKLTRPTPGSAFSARSSSKHQLGSEAAELLIQRIAGSTASAVVRKLQPELRIRESCGFALHILRPQRA